MSSQARSLILSASTAAIFIVALLHCAEVQAAPFASNRSWSIGIERAAGVDHTRIELNPSAGGTNSSLLATDTSTTTTSFLGNCSGFQPMYKFSPIPIPTPLECMPRLSVDRFLGPGISIGAGFSFQHSGNSKRQAVVSMDHASESTYLLAPRLGIAIQVRSWFHIWPRIGASYVRLNGNRSSQTAGWDLSSDSTYSNEALYLTVEYPMVFTAFEHVAVTAGPTFDWLVLGPNRTVKGDSVDSDAVHCRSFGFHSGIAVWF